MKTIYLYVLETLADWEIGYLTAELHSRRFFKQDGPQLTLKTVSYSREPITTMGGMTLTPDCLVSEISLSETVMLILPGADTWNHPEHVAILEKTKDLLAVGATVAGICGATVALANHGLLDDVLHTSNGPGFLEMFSPTYLGQDNYRNQPVVVANNLITANSTAGLLWTKEIIKELAVFQPATLTAWTNYFSSGDANYFYELLETLPASPQV